MVGLVWRQYSFAQVNTSSFGVKDLRFGDFDGDGATDVFGVVSNGQFNTWSYSKSATGSWAGGYLRPGLTTTVDGLFVADFNGTSSRCCGACDANTSAAGTPHTAAFRTGISQPGDIRAVCRRCGHFLGHAESDVLAWNDTDFWISVGEFPRLLAIARRTCTEPVRSVNLRNAHTMKR